VSLSTHPTPKELEAWLMECEEAGVQVFITAAAHLAGVVASLTILPLLAVPMEVKLTGTRFIAFNGSNARRNSWPDYRYR